MEGCSFGKKGHPYDLQSGILLEGKDNFSIVYSYGLKLMVKKIFYIVVDRKLLFWID